MDVIRRLEVGLDTVFECFGLIWDNKRLLAYLLVPKFLSIVVLLTIPDRPGFDFLELSMNLLLFASIFADIVLLYHTVQVADGKKLSIKKAIINCIPAIDQTMAWLLLLLFASSVYEPMNIFALPWLVTILAILFSLLTIFVQPAIALNKKPLLQLLVESPLMLKKLFWEILAPGGIFLIATLVIDTLPYLVQHLHFSTSSLKDAGIYSLMCIVIIVGMALETIATMVLALLYHRNKIS